MIVGVPLECGDNSGQDQITRTECNNQPFAVPQDCGDDSERGREGVVERAREKERRENITLNPPDTQQFILAAKWREGGGRICLTERRRREKRKERWSIFFPSWRLLREMDRRDARLVLSLTNAMSSSGNGPGKVRNAEQEDKEKERKEKLIGWDLFTVIIIFI